MNKNDLASRHRILFILFLEALLVLHFLLVAFGVYSIGVSRREAMIYALILGPTVIGVFLSLPSKGDKS